MVNRWRLLAVALCLMALAACGSTPAADKSPAPAPGLGINISGPVDWNTELPFVDVFRLSRLWISQGKGAPWGEGPELALDEHGWVQRLAPGCFAETPLCTIKSGRFPSGRYTVLYDGEGQVEFNLIKRVVSREPGRIVIDVDSSEGGFWVQIRETNPKDYVRNIRVIMPGFEESYQDNPFHPRFLERWRGVRCVRFMDWMNTNGCKIRTWDDRPKPDDANFSTEGVALEVMIDLCNRLGADAWFCIPYLADDDYVRRFAQMTKEQLDPKLKVHIEYSNEVWNTMFPQTRYAWEKGRELGLGPEDGPWEGGFRYYAKRSVEIFDIWEQVFGGRQRLVRVLAGQAANPWWMEHIMLPFQDAYRHADALAIAPYVGMNVAGEGEGLPVDQVAHWSVDKVLDHLEKEALPEAIGYMRDSKIVADKFGLKLMAYEGGQHMVGVAGGEGNEAVTRLLHAANAHPRMAQIYEKYYEGWTKAGGDLFCYYSSVAEWSNWGSWGIMQYYDDDPAKSPKLMSTMRWARQCGQPVRVP